MARPMAAGAGEAASGRMGGRDGRKRAWHAHPMALPWRFGVRVILGCCRASAFAACLAEATSLSAAATAHRLSLAASSAAYPAAAAAASAAAIASASRRLAATA